MAIGTNDGIEKFGTIDSVDSSSAAVNDGAMSAQSDITSWTNDDDAMMIRATLTFQYSTGTIDGKIALHMRQINSAGGAADEAIPTTSNKTGYVGTFDISPGTSASTDTAATLDVAMQNTKPSAEYELYLFNDSGVQIAAGWGLKITPLAAGPHA